MSSITALKLGTAGAAVGRALGWFRGANAVAWLRFCDVFNEGDERMSGVETSAVSTADPSVPCIEVWWGAWPRPPRSPLPAPLPCPLPQLPTLDSRFK